MFVTGSGPHAVAGYLVTYSQNPQVRASIALYEFADHASAVASLSEAGAYWGRGDTTLMPLVGLGDDRSFRAYGVGIGPGSGITFVDGRVVAYVRAEDESATDISGVNALCDSLAAAQDGLLQASGN